MCSLSNEQKHEKKSTKLPLTIGLSEIVHNSLRVLKMLKCYKILPKHDSVHGI